MGYYKVKLRATDRNYSRYIREKAGQKCEICGRQDIKLEAAHYHSRRHENIRFDDENVYCLCFNCHKKSHSDSQKEFKKFVMNKLGEKGFDLLLFRKNQIKKQDDVMDKIIIKEKLKSVGLKWK